MDLETILHRFPDIDRDEALGAQRILHARRSGVQFDDVADRDAVADSLPPAPAWVPPKQDDEDPDDHAADLAEYESRIAEYDALTDRMGRERVRTVEQVLDLMLTLGLVQADDRDGTQYLRLAADPPLPTEALPFTADQKAREDRTRWHQRFGSLSQRVLRLFLEDGQLAQLELSTTLDRLAATVGADVEDVRQAVLVLIDDGDFATVRQGNPVDVERLRAHQRFDLVVDPDRFAAGRINVSLNAPVEKPDA